MAGIRLTDPSTQNPFTFGGTVVGSYGILGTAIATWTVINHGLVTGVAGAGVTLAAGGNVTNGTTTDHASEIAGLTDGVAISGAGRVTNLGTIALLSTAGNSACGVAFSVGAGLVTNLGLISGSQAGVLLGGGGTVSNGPSGATQALIEGRFLGVGIYGGSGTVFNKATIVGGQIGVDLGGGGTLNNGYEQHTSALISGASGVWASGAPLVLHNSGTITATISNGVQLFAGGTVVNGSAMNRAATIYGYDRGVVITGTNAAVMNSGTIHCYVYDGVFLTSGGTLVNGSATDRSALISSASGATFRNYAVNIGGSGTVTNYGTIAGIQGIYFGQTGTSETVTNAGTIEGTGGVAVQFSNGTDRLIVDPGAAFSGIVAGGAGSNTLEFAAAQGAGTLSGLGTSFTNFGTLAVDSGANWVLAGTNRLGGSALVSIGSAATLGVAGTLEVGGNLSLAGSGTLTAKPNSVVEIGTAHTGASSAITVDPGARVTGNGDVVSARLIDDGTIVASGGSLRVVGGISGTGTVEVDSGARLICHAAVRSAIKFLAGNNESVLFNAPTLVGGTIAGFGTIGTLDRIDLSGFVATGSSASGGVLTLSSAGGAAVHLHFAANYQLAAFHVVSDDHGGTKITFV